MTYPTALTALATATEAITHSDTPVRLVAAALAGIATIIILIAWKKLHPFLALTLGSAVLAVVAGIPLAQTFTPFIDGLGSTIGGVGLLIAFGAIIGRLLIDSGGADQIVDTILAHTAPARLPWAMALAAFLIGIPLFFEVGIVLLIPVVMIVARHSRQPLVLVGIPALAGLSALHGLVPPHPGPLIAIDAVGANLGLTLAFGLLVSVPTVIVLMLARTVVETALPGDDGALTTVALFLGQPVVALLLTVLVTMAALGTRLGSSPQEVSERVGASLAPIAGILLIVGAGGGFKQTLVDSGIATVIASWIQQAAVPAIIAGWLVAVAVRLATGSATVATITAAGIMTPLAASMPATESTLLVLAIGAGSVFLSHVNDAGFWLVKEYFGMSVGQTFKTWSLMETILSVVALAVITVLALILGVL